METQYSDSLIICPEIANPKWVSRSTDLSTLFLNSYSSRIFTSLVLHKPLIAPASIIDLLLQRKTDSSYIHDKTVSEESLALINLLWQTNNLKFLPFDKEIEEANRLAELDEKISKEKGIFQGYEKIQHVKFTDKKGTTEVVFRSYNGPNYIYDGAIDNFIFLIFKNYQIQFSEYTKLTNWNSIGDSARLKNYLWGNEVDAEKSEIIDTEEILKLYIPYIDVITDNINIKAVEKILKIREQYIDAIRYWKSAIKSMEQTVEDRKKRKAELEKDVLIPVQEVLKRELRRGFTQGAVRDLLLSLVTIPIPIPWLSNAVSLVANLATKGIDFVNMKSQENKIDFYFYIQSLAVGLSSEKNNS